MTDFVQTKTAGVKNELPVNVNMKEDSKRRSVLHTTADDYAEGATVHGVGYIFNELLPTIDRVIWAVSVTFFFILAIFFTTNSYFDWQDNLVITTLKNTAKDVTELEFPAVTICSEGLNMDAVSKALARDFTEWSDEKAKKVSALKSSPNNPFVRLKREVVDASAYMEEKFGISSDSEFSIFDVVNAMSSSNVEKSTSSDGVRKNQLACAKASKASKASKAEVPTETLCSDAGGFIVTAINDPESLCFVAGSQPNNTKPTTFTHLCNKTNGLNTSLHIFPFEFRQKYNFGKPL